MDIRRELARDIELAGGNMSFKGLQSRLQSELEKLIGPSMKVNSIETSDKPFSAWKGGSIFATVAQEAMWVSKQLYDESGPPVIHTKVF